MDSRGTKSWQQSRLRTLEARGYTIKDDSHVPGIANRDDDIKSLTPFLVSTKSRSQDRAQFYEGGNITAKPFSAPEKPPTQARGFAPPMKSFSDPARAPKPFTAKPSPFKPGISAGGYPVPSAIEAGLPYCDL